MTMVSQGPGGDEVDQGVEFDMGAIVAQRAAGHRGVSLATGGGQPHTNTMTLADLQPLAATLQFLGTLARVLPWGLSVRPQWLVVDVVIQDEYTHDLILGSVDDPRALVLDCT
jgi:hypothetical protein